MSYKKSLVNAHPKPTRDKLHEIDGRVLVDLIIIVQSRALSPDRQELAGVPDLDVLQAELRGRESAGREVVR